MLRNWVKQAHRDSGLEVGRTTEDFAGIRRLRKEVADHPAHHRNRQGGHNFTWGGRPPPMAIGTRTRRWRS